MIIRCIPRVMKIQLPSSVILASCYATTALQTRYTQGRVFRSHKTILPFLFSTASSTSTEACVSIDNPLLDQQGLPRFAKIEPSNVIPAVETLIPKMDEEFAALEEILSNAESFTFDGTLDEVERIQSKLGYAWGVAGHLNGVRDSDELRDAYNKAQPDVIKAFTKFSQSKPLYDALSKLETSNDDDESSFEEMQKRRAIENNIRSMKLGGVGLEGKEKERFNEIKIRLSELGTKFSNNVLDVTKAFSYTITEKSDVENVPDSAKGMWAQAHCNHVKSVAKEGEEVASMDSENGPWRVTLDGPSYLAAMRHIPNRSIRERVYMAFLTRASEGEHDNTPIIYEILELKAEQSKMLGFDNYAELSLSKKMAPSVESVANLSDLINDKALPIAYKELEEITDMAKAKGGEDYASLEKLAPWDVNFWSERLKEEKFDITEEELRPYFALPAVLNGLFGLVSRIFEIRVEPADGEAEVWHPDVRFFNIYDEKSGKHIASFFLDPYSRPADKRGGAWMNDCIGKSQALKKDIPVAYLICNGSPPVGDDVPSLMTFQEVTTLFHEFGHGLQHMLTEASIGDVAGINGVEWDAVELPSQFMENWCYDKATVYGFAKHYKTGEALPEDKFQKLKDQKTFMAGSMACRQLYFGQLDVELHSNYNPANKEKENIFDVQKRIASKYSPHNLPLPEDRFLCAFSHIFAGGYSAGYFSYKWAEVMSADAFGAFEDVGLDNEEKVKEVGALFRKTVLALGGGVHPMDVFKRFRGREPTPDALLRHEGFV